MLRVPRKVSYGILGLALVLALSLASSDLVAASETPRYPCSLKVPEPEPANLATLAEITPDQAKAAAQAARPGSRWNRWNWKTKTAAWSMMLNLSTAGKSRLTLATARFWRPPHCRFVMSR